MVCFFNIVRAHSSFIIRATYNKAQGNHVQTNGAIDGDNSREYPRGTMLWKGGTEREGRVDMCSCETTGIRVKPKEPWGQKSAVWT